MMSIKQAFDKAFKEAGLTPPKIDPTETKKFEKVTSQLAASNALRRLEVINQMHENFLNASRDGLPSTFYELLQPCEPALLRFPSDADDFGPYWTSDGEIDMVKCKAWSEEGVSLVDLGGGTYRLVSKDMGPFSAFRLFWGDEFRAVKDSTGSLELKHIHVPQKFIHITFLIPIGLGSDFQWISKIHEMGGGCELVAGGMLTVSAPRVCSEDLQKVIQEAGLLKCQVFNND